MFRRHSRVRRASVVMQKRLKTMVQTPVFIALTVMVNGSVLIGGVLFYLVEHEGNPRVHGILDGVYWAMSTVTSTGYGDIVPMQTEGRLLAMAMMVGGSLITPLYTALFASALVAPELQDVERKVSEIESEMRTMTHHE